MPGFTQMTRQEADRYPAVCAMATEIFLVRYPGFGGDRAMLDECCRRIVFGDFAGHAEEVALKLARDRIDEIWYPGELGSDTDGIRYREAAPGYDASISYEVRRPDIRVMVRYGRLDFAAVPRQAAEGVVVADRVCPLMAGILAAAAVPWMLRHATLVSRRPVDFLEDVRRRTGT